MTCAFRVGHDESRASQAAKPITDQIETMLADTSAGQPRHCSSSMSTCIVFILLLLLFFPPLITVILVCSYVVRNVRWI